MTQVSPISNNIPNSSVLAADHDELYLLDHKFNSAAIEKEYQLYVLTLNKKLGWLEFPWFLTCTGIYAIYIAITVLLERRSQYLTIVALLGIFSMILTMILARVFVRSVTLSLFNWQSVTIWMPPALLVLFITYDTGIRKLNNSSEEDTSHSMLLDSVSLLSFGCPLYFGQLMAPQLRWCIFWNVVTFVVLTCTKLKFSDIIDGHMTLSIFFYAATAVTSVITNYIMTLHKRQRFLQRHRMIFNRKIIMEEQKHVQNLLELSLPSAIVAKLKSGFSQEECSVRREQAAVLFAKIDIPSSALPERSTDISKMEYQNNILFSNIQKLNAVFSYMDDVIVNFNVEKIKTIDCKYMCCAGVPNECPEPAVVMAGLSCAFREHMRKNMPNVQLTMGIDVGPVNAGIVGTNKFIFDVFSDTVNVASRMMSTCSVQNFTQVTAAVVEAINDSFSIESAGITEVKGKGKLEVFYLIGPKVKVGTTKEAFSVKTGFGHNIEFSELKLEAKDYHETIKGPVIVVDSGESANENAQEYVLSPKVNTKDLKGNRSLGSSEKDNLPNENDLQGILTSPSYASFEKDQVSDIFIDSLTIRSPLVPRKISAKSAQLSSFLLRKISNPEKKVSSQFNRTHESRTSQESLELSTKSHMSIQNLCHILKNESLSTTSTFNLFMAPAAVGSNSMAESKHSKHSYLRSSLLRKAINIQSALDEEFDMDSLSIKSGYHVADEMPATPVVNSWMDEEHLRKHDMEIGSRLQRFNSMNLMHMPTASSIETLIENSNATELLFGGDNGTPNDEKQSYQNSELIKSLTALIESEDFHPRAMRPVVMQGMHRFSLCFRDKHLENYYCSINYNHIKSTSAVIGTCVILLQLVIAALLYAYSSISDVDSKMLLYFIIIIPACVHCLSIAIIFTRYYAISLLKGNKYEISAAIHRYTFMTNVLCQAIIVCLPVFLLPCNTHNDIILRGMWFDRAAITLSLLIFFLPLLVGPHFRPQAGISFCISLLMITSCTSKQQFNFW